MYRLTSKLVIYRNFSKENILFRMAEICREFTVGEKTGDYDKEKLIQKIYEQVHRILDISTKYGFDKNLWHCYLAYLLAVNENSFSLTAEKTGAHEGSVNRFAKNDYKIFKALFDYDFSEMERVLGIDCFSVISNYQAIEKKEQLYNKNVSEKVRMLCEQIENSKDENEIFLHVTNFYRAYGVGKFGLNKAFRIGEHVSNGSMEDTMDWIMSPGSKSVELIPITNTQEVFLDDIVGYELQKQKLRENTESFVRGEKANNVLAFGDAGTGKSTSMKALLNEYYDQGLRMIEVYKHQFKDLSSVIAQIKNRNYRFIIYMDDLSFEEFEIEYKYLKAVIEGGLEIKPDNVLIYATSNRRHLIRETWNDRSDMETGEGMHRSDTMQEKLSLVARFGVTINYSKPSQKEYFHIVHELAGKQGISMSEEELDRAANQWELSHGGISGRMAQQLVTYLAGTKKE